MAFRFGTFCNLLSSLEDIVCHEPPYIPAERRQKLEVETRGWFRAHARAIAGLDQLSTVALISSLLPERRTDRVYGLQNATLSRLLSRTLGLPATKTRDLGAWKIPGNGDLGDCVQRALSDGGPPAMPAVTIEEVDTGLNDLARECRFSSTAIKDGLQSSSIQQRQATLANIFRRLHPKEAKWLVHLILKDFAPVCLDERLVLIQTHFLLPDILRFQQDFAAAVNLLKGPLKAYPSRPDVQSEPLLRKLVSTALRPVVGIKVSRPSYLKARSIDQCLKIMQDQSWLIERKYDGEYCEMHIDLSRGDDWLTIYSKSGKDSTADRAPLKTILRKCLGIGNPWCKVKEKCILLGELVVWSDFEQCILPFHKIRKHVTRSGSSLGTTMDSPPRAHEHVMIIFFDLLLLDATVHLNKGVEVRKAALNGLYRKRQGRAITAESRVLDFSNPESKRKLIAHFAASIAARHEGLVLKPCGQPYFSLSHTSEYAGPMKLKKDYIRGLGDEADFAIIGASYRAQDALRSSLQKPLFTHFHLGCLLNKDRVLRFDARPLYKVVGTVGSDQCIPPPILARANALAKFLYEPYVQGETPSTFDIESGASQRFHMDATLRTPLVFEVLGSSFDKLSDSNFWMLRHARVLKLHEDRSWRDCISFQELQAQAKAAVEMPVEAESQETLTWLHRVEQSCKRKRARLASTSPRSCATGCTSGRTSVTVTPDGKRALKSLSPNVRQSPQSTTSNTNSPASSKSVGRRAQGRTGLPVGNVTHALPTPPMSSPPPLLRAESSLRKRLLESAISDTRDKRARSSSPKAEYCRHESPVSLQIISPRTSNQPGQLMDCVAYMHMCTPRLADVLAEKACAVIHDLGYWNRSNDEYLDMSDTVGESQSFPGLTKIAIVPDDAPMSVLRDLLGRVNALDNGRGLRDKVWIVPETKLRDWRQRSEGSEAQVSKFAFGLLVWNEAMGRNELRLH